MQILLKIAPLVLALTSQTVHEQISLAAPCHRSRMRFRFRLRSRSPHHTPSANENAAEVRNIHAYRR